jgi:branched-chain amino acid transport system ATP-binding protein
MTTLLTVDQVRKGYGSLTAVDGVSLTVGEGGRHAVIGSNGAGKTTLLNLVAGLIRPDRGRVRLDDTDITRHGPAHRARLGIGRTHQQPAVWATLTALDNVVIAGWRQLGGWRAAALPARRADRMTQPAGALLERLGIAGCAMVAAGQLSHGQRRQLEIAMALAGEPRLLLLDEPAAGLSPAEIERLAGLLARLPRDVAVLMVEHQFDLVDAVADTVSVMSAGRTVASGTPAEVKESTTVRDAYPTAVA